MIFAHLAHTKYTFHECLIHELGVVCLDLSACLIKNIISAHASCSSVNPNTCKSFSTYIDMNNILKPFKL